MKLGLKLVFLLALTCASLPTAVHAQQATETIVHSFSGPNYYEVSQLIHASDGNFYGTAGGGANETGVVYRLTPSGTVTTIYTFSAANKGSENMDGDLPDAALVQGSDGNLYGVTLRGGPAGRGTVFSLTLSGTLTTIHSFAGVNEDGVNLDGAQPEAALIQGSDGSFYGTTSVGGGGGTGTVYSITSSGVFTLLHRFSAVDADINTDGAYPRAALIESSSGEFFGTTYEGGSGSTGTVFKINAKKAFETVHNFATADRSSDANEDGAYPEASLLQVNDTTFYGTASMGGSGGRGTIFKITTAGALTTLYNFNVHLRASQGNIPEAALIEGPGGLLYGVTADGGTNEKGTAFSITLSGHLHTLYTFGDNGGVADAQNPASPLLLADDGTLYGTSVYGGTNNYGTIYQLTLPD